MLEGDEIEISASGLDLIIKTTSTNKQSIYKSDEIDGFVFGGFTSRFWLMKNYINNLKPSEHNIPSMFCWNMISIQIKNKAKQLHLIIPDQT